MTLRKDKYQHGIKKFNIYPVNSSNALVVIFIGPGNYHYRDRGFNTLKLETNFKYKYILRCFDFI